MSLKGRGAHGDLSRIPEYPTLQRVGPHMGKVVFLLGAGGIAVYVFSQGASIDSGEAPTNRHALILCLPLSLPL